MRAGRAKAVTAVAAGAGGGWRSESVAIMASKAQAHRGRKAENGRHGHPVETASRSERGSETPSLGPCASHRPGSLVWSNAVAS